MAQLIGRLSAIKISNLKEPGYYADGGNLYFRIARPHKDVLGKDPDAIGARGWVFRFTVASRTRDMGLGAFPEISLAAARELAGKCRKLVTEGIDPIEQRRAAIEQRRADRAAQRVAAAKSKNFEDCARECIADREAAWRNAKHRMQWSSSLKRYANPTLGKLPAAEIDDGLVLRVLKPIWQTKPETASRVRGRIESVLDWARVHGYRKGENPARWKGHLDQILPPRSRVRRVRHHPALPFAELPDFMVDLRAQEGVAARALEFTILTVARTNETIGAPRTEINATQKTWIVPADRMKAEKDHRVPLTARALSIVQDVQSDASSFLFPAAKGGSLSNMAMAEVIRRMNANRKKQGLPPYVDPLQNNRPVVPHGFRSTFRDWAEERTNYPTHVVEMALAHTVDDKVEAAYRRGDLFEKRRRLMAAWAEYSASAPAGEVVLLRKSSGPR